MRVQSYLLDEELLARGFLLRQWPHRLKLSEEPLKLRLPSQHAGVFMSWSKTGAASAALCRNSTSLSTLQQLKPEFESCDLNHSINNIHNILLLQLIPVSPPKELQWKQQGQALY